MQNPLSHLSRLSSSLVTFCRFFAGKALRGPSGSPQAAFGSAACNAQRTRAAFEPCVASPMRSAAPTPVHGASLRRPRAASSARSAGQPLRAVRVLRHREGSAEHLAIVGRMGDVCAELDRLAARERLC